jgi:hypothetical protein
MIVVVPPGDAEDPTRDPTYYEETYEYLRSAGMELIGSAARRGRVEPRGSRFFFKRVKGIGPRARWRVDDALARVQAKGQHQEYVFEVPGDDAAQEQV